VPGLTSWVTLLVCFLAGALTWGTGLTYLVAWGSTRAGHRLQRIVEAVSAVVLGWFGVRLLWTSLQRIRPFVTPLTRSLV